MTLVRRAAARPVRRPDPGPRAKTTLAVAALGHGLSYWAWTLVGPLGPELGHGSRLSPAGWALLGAITITVGSLVRVPAGVLADRYGASPVIAAISVAAALTVLGLAAAGTLPSLFAVSVATGVAGGAFSAGAALVVRTFAAGRRGFALSVFGAGMGVASAAAIASRLTLSFDRDDALLLLGTALLAYAGVLLGVVREPHPPAVAGHPATGAVRAVLRMPAALHLSSWYTIACGGMVAYDLYLPSYLTGAYRLSWSEATLLAAAGVGVAAAGCPLGGWLCRRHDPTRLLTRLFGVTAVLLAGLAVHPPSVGALAVLAGTAVCLGVSSGVVLTLLGRTVPVECAGTVAGVLGAAGGLAGVVPSLLLTALVGLHRPYGVGLILLAGAALATAAHLHSRRAWIGAAAAFPAAAVSEQSAQTTVVALSAAQAGPHAAEMVTVLAALAARHELVIVYAEPEVVRGHGLVAGLRAHLPRHCVVAVATACPPHPDEIATIADLLQCGAVAVALTGVGDPDPTALAVAAGVDADQVLCLTPDRVTGSRLQPRPLPPTVR